MSTTTTIQDELQAAQIRLAAALRAQQELEQKEAELAQTRSTLATAKEDTAALQAQLKQAMELSIRNKLEQLDNETRIAQAQAAAKAAADTASHAAKIATAKAISDNLQAIREAATRADTALAAYTAALVEIKQLKRQVNADLSASFVTESWQQLPGDSVENEAREAKTELDNLYRFHTELKDARNYSIVRNAVQSFISQAGEYIVGFAK